MYELCSVKLRSVGLVSIIVATRNRGKNVLRLVESLRDQSCIDWELIIVDQSDVPLLLEELSSDSKIQLIFEKPGLSRARNRGASIASGSHLLFADDDCWFDARSLGHLRAAIESERQGTSYLGQVLDQSGKPLRQCPVGHRRFLSRWETLVHTLSAGMVVPRKVFLSVGGFDESLGLGAGTATESGEDADLMLRVASSGTVVEFLPEFIVYHPKDSLPFKRDRLKVSGFVFGALMRKHRFGMLIFAYCILRSIGGIFILSLTRRSEEVPNAFTFGWARVRGYALNPLKQVERQ
jgi:GT2 family glycosyltransferase